jgi:hypothetical protein
MIVSFLSISLFMSIFQLSAFTYACEKMSLNQETEIYWIILLYVHYVNKHQVVERCSDIY